MGFFGKLFGKKDDELGLEDHSLDLGEKAPVPEPETGPELPPHLTEPEAPETLTAPTTPAAIPPRELELINSKLDTLKAILNSMDQRIANLEKVAGVEQKKMPW